MNIEIVGFYPLVFDKKKPFLEGTLHIYIIDLDIDIRGIYVINQKKRWIFRMPHKRTIDSDTKESVGYPIFSFTNAERNAFLLKAIINQGSIFMDKHKKDLDKIKKKAAKSSKESSKPKSAAQKPRSM